MPLVLDDILVALRANLSDDMLSAQWRRIVSSVDHAVAGHCAIASEALYDLLGGALAGYTPYVCGHGPESAEALAMGETHWWLRGPKGAMRGAGDVLDTTAAQFEKPFPYGAGKPAGFMSPTPPSRRARVVISRVEAALGAQAVAVFRQEQIVAFAKAGGQVTLGKADLHRRNELARRMGG